MSKLTKEEVEKLIFMHYGNCITLKSNERSYSLENRYVFVRRNPAISKSDLKEFTETLQNMLYRNYYWIDSEYRKNAIYSRILLYLDGYSKNEDKTFPLEMKDGNTFIFKPDYISKDNKTFLHYFDMSYYLSSTTKRELLNNIIDFFEESKEYNLEMYEGSFCSKDFD